MADGNTQNGNGNAPAPWLELHITRQTAGARVVIGFRGENLDEALNALETAKRELEARWRYEKANELSAQALRAAEDAQIAQRALNRRQ